MKLFHSQVKGHQGMCSPTWLNTDTMCNRIDGGVSGFFKLVKRRFGLNWRVGKEFHGVLIGDTVYINLKSSRIT